MCEEVQAWIGRNETGGPRTFGRCVAGVDEPIGEIVAVACWAEDFERAVLERGFAGDLEIAMIVAVIAEEEIDVASIAGADEVGVCLKPGVVGLGECGKEDEEDCGS